MSAGIDLSIVIALQHAGPNLPAILAALDPAQHPNVEFIFSALDSHKRELRELSTRANIEVVLSEKETLIPHLWQQGILSARAEKIAITTAHCVPAPNWVNTLLSIDLTATPGVGGAIVNDPGANAMSWAVYLLRYISYCPPLASGHTPEIAADNALYRRADIMKNADLLQDGFWEPSFHRRYHQAGLSLSLNPDLLVTHRNRYTTGQFFRQRLAHGKAFGVDRCMNLSRGKRSLLIVLSPLLPFLFLAKIFLRVIRKRRFVDKLILCLPWLLIFLTGWGLGEARGYLAGASNAASTPVMDEEQAGQ